MNLIFAKCFLPLIYYGQLIKIIMKIRTIKLFVKYQVFRFTAKKEDFIKDMYSFATFLLFWISMDMFFDSVKYSSSYWFSLFAYLYSMIAILWDTINFWYFDGYKPFKKRLNSLKFV